MGSTNYAYDANGNMTTRGGQTLTWNVENQVTTVSGGATFVYDGDGNRVKKLVLSVIEGTEGGLTILYINQYYEKNLTTGVTTTSYYLGGILVAQKESAETRYAHRDRLSGTSAMSRTDGASDGSIKYLPFGDTWAGSVPQQIGNSRDSVLTQPAYTTTMPGLSRTAIQGIMTL